MERYIQLRNTQNSQDMVETNDSLSSLQRGLFEASTTIIILEVRRFCIYMY